MQQKAIKQKIKAAMQCDPKVCIYFISACDIRLKQYLKGIQLQAENNVFPKSLRLFEKYSFKCQNQDIKSKLSNILYPQSSRLSAPPLSSSLSTKTQASRSSCCCCCCCCCCCYCCCCYRLNPPPHPSQPGPDPLLHGSVSPIFCVSVVQQCIGNHDAVPGHRSLYFSTFPDLLITRSINSSNRLVDTGDRKVMTLWI